MLCMVPWGWKKTGILSEMFCRECSRYFGECCGVDCGKTLLEGAGDLVSRLYVEL